MNGVIKMVLICAFFFGPLSACAEEAKEYHCKLSGGSAIDSYLSGEMKSERVDLDDIHYVFRVEDGEVWKLKAQARGVDDPAWIRLQVSDRTAGAASLRIEGEAKWTFVLFEEANRVVLFRWGYRPSTGKVSSQVAQGFCN